MKKLTVILPCYNEQENIKLLLENWLNLKDNLLVLGYELSLCCVDDGSTDNTASAIKEEAKKNRNVILHAHEKNKGLGRALATGIAHFNDHSNSGDLALVMDSDNTHDPKYVFSMLTKMNQGADCVIASRYQAGASVRGVPAHRLFLSDCAKFYFSFVLRVKNVRDYTCGYRLYSSEIIRKAVDQYDSDLIIQDGFACMIELLYKLYLLGATFAEIPFELKYDQKRGKSKMKLLKTIFYSLFTAASLRLKLK